MSEIRMLVVGDIHAVSHGKSPGYRTESYATDILTKLRETVEVAKNSDATHVLWLGDVFDDKTASKVTFRLVKEIQEIIRSYGLEISILVGNHDLAPGANLESLSKQPIGMLEEMDCVTLLTHDELKLNDEVSIFPVPGIPLEREGDLWLESFKTHSTVKRRIIAAHQLIVPDLSVFPIQAQDSFYEASRIAQHTDAQLVIYGDHHRDQGIYKKGTVGFINMGSLCRQKVDEVDHIPSVYILTIRDDERRSIATERFILKSVRPSAEVFRLEEAVAVKEYKADIDETIRQLKTQRIGKFSVDAVMEDIKNNDTVESPVRSMAVSLVESVR